MSAHRILQNASKFTPLLMKRLTTGGGARVQNQAAAFISTSKKNRDTTITADQAAAATTGPKTATDFADPARQNYQHFGFEPDDPEMDVNYRNHMMFFTVTLGLVGGGFIMMYTPDVRMRDWNQREAYIELARREALGLPAVDPNLVPPENVNLPTEEELGDFEIII